MFAPEQYSLLDFGNGRRLERFGILVLDRPCPSANEVRIQNPDIWKQADARFEEIRFSKGGSSRNSSVKNDLRGVWKPLSEVGLQYFCPIGPDGNVSVSRGENEVVSRPWTLEYNDLFSLELKGSPFGHIGVFPEQAENWDRIFRLCTEGKQVLQRPLRVLNLFGYTGGSTLAAMAAGAETTHLDSAKNVVAQAKRNADISFETNETVGKNRWIVDDAVKFVKREVKRGSFYDGVILDPPSYGHGAHGEVWRFSRDLAPLLETICELLNGRFSFVILSGHTPNFNSSALKFLLTKVISSKINVATVKTSFFAKTLSISSIVRAKLYAGDLAVAKIVN